MRRHLRYTLLLGVVLSLVSFPTVHCSGEEETNSKGSDEEETNSSDEEETNSSDEECFSPTPFQLKAYGQAGKLYKEYSKKGKCKDDTDCVVINDFLTCDPSSRVGVCGIVLHRDLVEEYNTKKLVIHEKCLLQIKQKRLLQLKDCKIKILFSSLVNSQCSEPIPECNSDGECKPKMR